MLDEALVASAVVEEKCGHRAYTRPVAGSEVTIHEAGRRARRAGITSHARRVGRCLHSPKGKWNDEVAVHAADHPTVHHAWRASIIGVTRTRAGAFKRGETAILELLNYREGAVGVVSDGEDPVECVMRPVDSTGS